MKKRILCFGDSNTWAYRPENGTRFDKSVRWTGLLETKLGNAYEVIEEGLNGRTTDIDYNQRPGKNGSTYLAPCMDSQFPLDHVILCLGTNDTKVEFGRSPEDIAAGLENVIQIILGKGLERPSPQVKLLVLSPILVHEAHIGDYADFVGAEAKTRGFGALFRAVAQKYDAGFIDLAPEIEPSPVDGCHLSPEGHAKVCDLVFAHINK